MPVADEVAAELARADLLAARSKATGAWWLGSPDFSASSFGDSAIAALLQITPEATRKLVAARAKERAEAWPGLRMPPADRERRLVILRGDLRSAQARLELARQAVEEATGQMQPRVGVGEDPAVWLMMPSELVALAGSGNNGRAK